MKDISKRLKIVRGSKTQSDFASKIGVPLTTLGRYERGENLPDLEFIYNISKQLNISTEWLINGIGSMELSEALQATNKPNALLTSQHYSDVDIIMIPMAEARLSAGCGSLEVDAKSERKYAFRSDFLFRKGSPNDMILMRVSGDSMAPEIEDNDVVLLDQSRKEITPGRLYAVGFEDAIYLKRIDKLPGKVVLKSTNPAYPPVELNINGDCEDLFRVIGRVLWCGREYK